MRNIQGKKITHQFFFILSVGLVFSGCTGTISGDLQIYTSLDEVITIDVINNSGDAICANVNGFLLPILSAGDTSEQYSAHIFNLPGIHFAVASPDNFFPFHEEMTNFVPVPGTWYRPYRILFFSSS